MIDLTLNTVCGGYLEQEFKRYLPMLLEAMQESKKAVSLNIKVTFKPIADMETTFTSHATIKPALPVREKGGFCQVIDGRVMVEPKAVDMTLPIPFPADMTVESIYQNTKERA